MPKPKTVSPPDMSIKDVAAYLNVTDRYVRYLIADGILPAYRLGRGRGCIRLRKSEVDEALQPMREAL